MNTAEKKENHRRYNHAIVRTPCRNMVNGLTSADLGKPDYSVALAQHQAYIHALIECGLNVKVLPADEEFPDSTFVEDTALLTAKGAIIARPGAESRLGEIDSMIPVITEYYENIRRIEEPGTVEPGDVLMVGEHFYIGLSNRTNQAGSVQLIRYLKEFGYTASLVKLKEMLHLKTGIAYLENGVLVAAGEFINNPMFSDYDIVSVSEQEAYAANCLWINEKVLIPAGFPNVSKQVEAAGYETITLNMSEYQKLDGGLSCLSLRF